MNKDNNIVMICNICSENRKKFWQQENKNLIIRSGDYIKVRVMGKDKDGKEVYEHPWFVVNGQIKQDIFDCALQNKLASIVNTVVGDQYAIKFEDIEDHIDRGMSMEEYNKNQIAFIERFRKLYPHNHENKTAGE